MIKQLAALGASAVALAFVSASAQTPVQSLQIATAKGVYSYEVEVADNEPSRELGLMNRTQMQPIMGCCSSSPNALRSRSG